ncbi:MAG: hypothetical protein JW940_07055 [Polyangiaceae bacterium]|nr:hypothetical protein [Polyangiaceae bacterium]
MKDAPSAPFTQSETTAATATNNIELSTADQPDGEIFYNASGSAREVELSQSYEDLDGHAVSGPLTLEPYESVILIRQ